MIRLASIIDTFESQLVDEFGNALLPSHRQALSAMKRCRTSASPMMLAQCSACENQILAPHSCGHRSCPHCQHHESQQWLEQQRRKRVSSEYFLLTFTLPKQFRSLAWLHQRMVYDVMIRCSWETVRTFALNDKQLRGTPGAISVLHTNNRRLDFHPHVHLVMPAAAVDIHRKLWRTKRRKRTLTRDSSGYLFNHKAVAKVFRAKLLDAINQLGLALPPRYPKAWVVDIKSVGSGDKALVYLGRYLYRGVIREKDILASKNGQVTFRYRDSKTHRVQYRTVPGTKFLRLILRHVLPKRFRRVRNFGFLHPNTKRLITLIQVLFGINPNATLPEPKKRPEFTCRSCGATMIIVATRISGQGPPDRPESTLVM